MPETGLKSKYIFIINHEVILWCSRLKIWSCLSDGLGHCYGMGPVLSQELAHAEGVTKKMTIKKNMNCYIEIHYLSQPY